MDELSWSDWLFECASDPQSPTKLTPDVLGMLTGQDKRTLAAIAACWQLYASSDDDGRNAALIAVRSLLPGMQEKCWFFARELIAFALDWSDREKLWPLVLPTAGETKATLASELDDRALHYAMQFQTLLAGLQGHSRALQRANQHDRSFVEGWRSATNTCLGAINAFFSGEKWPLIEDEDAAAEGALLRQQLKAGAPPDCKPR